MGKAPILLKDVLPGNHWVRAQSPGEDPIVKRLLVRSRKTISVTVTDSELIIKSPSPIKVGRVTVTSNK